MNKEKTQASHKHSIPAKLGGILEISNIAPTEPLTNIFIGEGKWQSLESRNELDNYIAKYEKVINQYPKLKEYIGPLQMQYGQHREIIKKLRFLLAIRHVLESIVKMDKSNYGSRIKYPPYELEIVRLHINEQGRIDFIPSPILEALNGIEAKRIRKCPICKSFFWASRIDQSCCKKQCAHVLRTRRWRDNYQKKYKYQRATK